MGRPYRASGYARVVEGLVRARPGAAVGADVMAGFPGESEADHRDTLALVASLPLAYLHVFAFSARPGTRAAGMRGAIPSEVAARRAGELREVSARRWAAFQDGLRGRELEVVVERIRGVEASGTSREYATVLLPARDAVRGAAMRVRAGDEGVLLGSKVARALAPS